MYIKKIKQDKTKKTETKKTKKLYFLVTQFK